MMNVLFATCAVGEKYNKRCLTSLKCYDKLDYDKNDELIIYTDDVNFYKDLDLKIKLTIRPFSIDLKGNNFRDNTLLKHLCLTSALSNNNTHELFVWYDCDSFPIIKKKLLTDGYRDFEYGIFYKDAHTFNNFGELLDHHLYKDRGSRYNVHNFLMVTHKDNMLIEYAFNKNDEITFPVETCLLIKRNCSSNEYNNIEKTFCNTTIDLVKYCMDVHLNDNYGESYELGIIIGKSFKTINQMPVIPCMCDFHYMPADSEEEDIERYKDRTLYKEFLS
jgi:hypothetical protein